MTKKQLAKREPEGRRLSLHKKSATRMQIVLDNLARGYSVAAAARAAGIDRSTAFNWRKEDPEFAARWEEAMEAGIDLLEDEALRRGVEGIEEPVIHGGERVFDTEVAFDEDGKPKVRYKRDEHGRAVPIVRRVYSDRLLEMMLKGRRPNVYAEKRAFGMKATVPGADGEDRVLQIEFVESS